MDYDEWVQKSKVCDQAICEAQDHLDRLKQTKKDLNLNLIKQAGSEIADAATLEKKQSLSQLKEEGRDFAIVGAACSLTSLILAGLAFSEGLYIITGACVLMLIAFMMVAKDGYGKSKKASKVHLFLKEQSQRGQWKDILKKSLIHPRLKTQMSAVRANSDDQKDQDER